MPYTGSAKTRPPCSSDTSAPSIANQADDFVLMVPGMRVEPAAAF
jgi:hypothetical protein